ncbi:MAG: hypothetical protein H6843_02670 [Rhodospirillaceae bacterium]|nr:hypothetical protein [Rhodospirillaceae bacterium]
MTTARNTAIEASAGDASVQVFPRESNQHQYIEYRRQVSRTRRLVNLSMVVVCLCLPIVLGAIYYYGFAADRYVSETQVMVRRATPAPAPTDLLANLAGSRGAAPTNHETGVLIQYWHSTSLVTSLANVIDLRELYNRAPDDFVFRLGEDVSDATLINYFANRFHVSTGDSGIITLRVQAFNAEDAQAIAEAMLNLGLERINQLNEDVVRSTLVFARREVSEAEERVRQAQTNLTEFQLREQSIDPEQASSAIGSLVASLEADLASARAELAQALSYLDEGSATVRGLQARISAVEQQIEIERARITGGEQAMVGTLGEFNRLSLEVELATQALVSTLASYQTAVNEVQRQSVNMLVVSPPHLPDAASYPQRAVDVALVALCAVLVFTIVYLFASAIRDHMF